MDEDKLFSPVKFFIAQCDSSDEIKHLLLSDGARHINYLSEHVTHVIADKDCPDAEEAVELWHKPVVTSTWVHQCLRTKRLLPPEAYSPLRRIFRDVVTSFSRDLSRSDINALAATITYYGGTVVREREQSTHFIAASSKPTEFQDGKDPNDKLKIVAPDWILESVKQKVTCDETLFDPSLLLPPPPPPPPKQPTPPPLLPSKQEQESTMIETNAKKGQQADDNHSKTPAVRQNNHLDYGQPQKIDTQLPQPNIRTQGPPNHQQYQSQQQSPINSTQAMPSSPIPRQRMAANVTRGPQTRLRHPLPTNNQQPRPHAQPITRMVIAENQQPRKIMADYNSSYRKVGPYQVNPDLQHSPQPSQLTQPHMQVDHPQMHQQGPMTNLHNRMAPNMYQQNVRPHYQNSQIPPRMPPNMMNQQQMQSPQVQRFQDPNSQFPQQRPYSMPGHPQPQQQPIMSPNYQQGPMQRQPVYYNQTMGNMSMRMTQQVPLMRSPMVSNDQQMISESTQQYQNQHQPQQPMYHQQNHNQPIRGQIQPQPQSQPFQQPHPPVPAQPRPQFQPIIPNAVTPPRGPRQVSGNQVDVKSGPRHASHGHERVPRGPRAAAMQPQPHPSIFDLKQESSYAQMKAKVPDLSENIEYFNYADGFVPPPDKPFTACRFKMIEHEDVSEKVRNTWCDVIVEAGGKFEEDMDKLTHLICESQSTPEFKLALEKGIRCVSIHWIDDVLGQDRLEYPWRALHIPIAFKRIDKPLKNQIISTTNIHGEEKRKFKEMIKKTGAKYTDYLSPSNTLLICGAPGGEKFERAVEWRIPIANCQLLSDYLINGRDFAQMLEHATYQNFNRGDQLKLDSYVLIRDLMSPWTRPIPAIMNHGPNTNGTPISVPATSELNTDSCVTATSVSNTDPDVSKSRPESVGSKIESKDPTVNPNSLTISEEDSDKSLVPVEERPQEVGDSLPNSNAVHQSSEVISAVAAPVESTTGPVDKEIEKPTKKLLLRTSKAPVRILFTQLERRLVAQLEEYVTQQCMKTTRNPKECTHLVVGCISRSPNFIMAISHASFVLHYQWLIDSHKAGQTLDEKAYILQDPEGEKKFSFNLAHTLLNRSKRPGLLFDNYIFFVTPTVQKKVACIEKMIDSAGGRVELRNPPYRSQRIRMKMEGKHFVIITHPNDAHLVDEYRDCNIMSVEFILSNILRQKVEFEAHRLDRIRDERGKAKNQLPNHQQLSPPKRLRQA